MLFYTHLIFAFLFGILSMNYVHPANQVLFIVLVVFGGTLPDVDSSSSKLGSKVKVVSWFFKHRGFFHSLFVLPFISLILYFIGFSNFAIPIIIGYVSHLIADSMTKEGIMFLYPLSKAKIKGFIRTGGFLEKIIFIILVVLSGYSLLHS